MRIYANTFCILILTYLFTFIFTLCVPPPLCALRVVCFYCLFVLGTFMRHARPCTRQHTHIHTEICKTFYATYTTNLTPTHTHTHTTTHNNNKHNNNQTGTTIGTFSRSPTSPGSWNDEDGALSSVSYLYRYM